MIPVVAIVGRPSVGKSTLFNRLCGQHDAIVDECYGVTRDRIYGRARIAGRTVILVDTGGLDDEDTGALQEQVREQVEVVLEQSDAVLFMVDASTGLIPQDEALARRLRGIGPRPAVVANKAETSAAAANSTEFHRLGLGAPLALSAKYGDGVGALRTALEALLSAAGAAAPAPAPPGVSPASGEATTRVAVVGRPNTGKSTLVNALAGEQRVIVMDEPGTTRDSIRVPVKRDGRAYELIDTAGVRRRARVHETVEKVSVIKTLQSLEEVVVALLMLDARAGVAEQDLRLAGIIEDSGRALVVVVNKWDGLDERTRSTVRNDLERRLRFLPPHQTLFISALHGSNLGRVPDAIDRACEGAMRELSAGRLNRVLREALEERSPPGGARPARLKYCHQGGRNPPRVIIHGIRTHTVPASYRRYLANRFQRAFQLTGVRVKIIFKETGRG